MSFHGELEKYLSAPPPVDYRVVRGDHAPTFTKLVREEVSGILGAQGVIGRRDTDRGCGVEVYAEGRALNFEGIGERVEREVLGLGLRVRW